MSWIFILIILSTLMQILLCRTVDWFLLSFLVVIIARILFFSRLLGAMIKVKSLIVMEGFAIGILILFNLLSKAPNNYFGLLFYLLWSGVACFCMWADDTFFLYVTEDFDEKKDEE